MQNYEDFDLDSLPILDDSPSGISPSPVGAPSAPPQQDDFDLDSLPIVFRMDNGEDRFVEPNKVSEFLRSPEYREGAAQTIAADRAKIEASVPMPDSQGTVSAFAEGALKGGLRSVGKIGGAFAGIGTGPMRAVGMLMGRDNALVKGADWVDEKFDWFADDLGVGRTSGDGTADTLASIGEVGSSALTNLMPWLVGGGAASKIAGKALFAANVAGAGGRSATQMYDDLKAAGADEETAMGGARAAQAVSTTAAFIFGKLSLENYLTGIGAKSAAKLVAGGIKPSAKGFEGIVKNVANGMMRRDIASRLVGAAEEGLTEGAESFILNAIRQKGSKGNVDWEEALLESLQDAGVGAAVGGVLAGVRVAEGRRGFRGAYEKAARAEALQMMDSMTPADIREMNPKAFDSAAQKRANGGEISRKDAEEIGMPTSWPKERRNMVFDSWIAENAPSETEVDTSQQKQKEAENEARTDEAPAQPQQGAVGTGQAEAETPRPVEVGAQSAEADGVVEAEKGEEFVKSHQGKEFLMGDGRVAKFLYWDNDKKSVRIEVRNKDGSVKFGRGTVESLTNAIANGGLKPIAETPVEASTSAPSAEGAITQPKATESAESGISQSDGAITPEEAAKERKKGKRIPKTAVKTEGTAPVAPTAAKPTKTVKTNPKKAAAIVKNFAAKDDPRVSLKRIHHDHDSRLAVATDGRVFIATKHGYDPNYEDNPDAPYPKKWKDVIPNYDKGTVTFKGKKEPIESIEIDPESVAKVCATAKRIARGVDKKANARVVIPLKSGSYVVMDADSMQKVAKAMSANGITEIKSPSNGNNSILAKNADTTIVAMPLRANGKLSKGRSDDSNEIYIDATTGKVYRAPTRPNAIDTDRKKAVWDEIDSLWDGESEESAARPEASAPAVAPTDATPTSAKEGSGAQSPSVAPKAKEKPPKRTTPAPKAADSVKKSPAAPTFKRGERVFLKGAEKNQSVTFLKANPDGTVDVQVRTPGANRYASTTAETRTVPAADVSATGLKGTLSASEKDAMKKGEESEASIRQGLAAYGMPEANADSKINREERKSEKNPLGQIVPPEDGSVAQEVDAEIAAEGKQGVPPSPAPGSSSNPSLDPFYEPESLGAGVKNPISRQEIVNRFKELFKDSVAIRGKGTVGVKRGSAGHYEPDSGVIRTKNPVSMRTIPHEIGHHIDTVLKRAGLSRPRAVSQELVDLGKQLYGNKNPVGGYEAEGFAELVKYYLHGNDAGLKGSAPKTYDWFVNQFCKAFPDTAAKLDELRDMIDRLQNQSGEDAVKAIRAKNLTLGEKMVNKYHNLLNAVDASWEGWIDQGAFIEKGMKASGLDKLTDWRKALKDGDAAKASEIIENDPRLKYKLYNGKAGARAYTALEKGLTDLSGTRRYTYGDLGVATPGHAASETLPTFKEIFGDFTSKEMDDFQTYAIARIAKEAYLDKGLQFGLTQNEVAPVLRKYANNTKFREALERYTHYKHGVLHLLVDAGAMSQAQFEAIVAANPVYVKISRRRDAVDVFRNAMLNRRGKAVNQRTGSGRQIEDIFDAGLVDDERVFAAAMQADVLRSIVELGKKGERAGGVKAGFSTGANWLREVPNAKGAVKFTAEKLRKQITDAMQGAAVAGSKADADSLFDQLFSNGKDVLTIFKEKPSNGKNGIVSLYDQDGNLHTYELPENNAKGWAEGLLGFTDGSKPNILEQWAQIAAAATRSGATVLNPTFAVRNLVRDTLHAAVVNEYGWFIPGYSTVQGVAMDLFNTQSKQMFEAMGLQMGSMLGEAKLQSAKKANKYLMSKNWFTRQMNKGVKKMIADFVGFSENGSRIKEFKNVRDYMLKHGASEKAAAMLAGANALDITIDFQRGGKQSKRINRFVPFFNAGIQGLEQTARTFGLLKAQAWQLEGSRKKKAAKTLLKGGAYITMLALAAELFNHDDDERKERMADLKPHEKWNYIPFGDVRIPVPYEIGYVFASIPRAVYAEVYDGQKGAIAECLSMMWKVLPGLSLKNIAGLGPILSVAMNETWTGSAIVPEHIMRSKKSYDWYDSRTTEFSKYLAKAFHKVFGDSYIASPAHLDALFNGLTGNMYGRLLSIGADVAKLRTGQTSVDSTRPHTWPVIGTMFRNNMTASRALNDFYEMREELTRKKGSKEATEFEQRRLHWANRIARVLSNLRKDAESIKANESLTTTERNNQLEAIAERMKGMVRDFNAAQRPYR